MGMHKWEDLRHTKHGLRARQAQMKCRMRVVQTTMRAWLFLSLSPAISLHMYCTICPLNKFLFYYFPSLWEFFFLQSLRVRALSLTTGLVVRIQCSHCYKWPQSLARNWSPTSSCHRLRPPEIIPIWSFLSYSMCSTTNQYWKSLCSLVRCLCLVLFLKVKMNNITN